jgi:hypothetical protein
MIFEGAPGAGKSSLSQYVAQLLGAAGEESVWIEEHELNDRWFGDFFDALDSDDADPVAAALACWRDLLAQIASDRRTYLIDGGYFHTTLKSLLAHNTSVERIDACVADLHALLAPHRPVLVHLGGDVAVILQHAIAERGPRWAANVAADIAGYPMQAGKGDSIDAMVDFFTASQAELDRIAASYPFERWQIDTTARDWPAYHRDLARRLGLPYIEPSAARPELDLAAYVAVYRTPDFFPDAFRHPLEVEMGADGLRLHTGFLRNFRLIAEQPDRFAIAARPHAVEFVRNETGQLTGLIYPFVLDQRFFCPRV